MGNQADFDAKIERATVALDAVAEAVTAESAQIAQWIAENPGVNTSGLDAVVARLENVAGSVANVFDPELSPEPTPEPEPEPTPEPEPIPEPEPEA